MSFNWGKTDCLIILNEVQMDLTPECHIMKVSCFHHCNSLYQFYHIFVGKGNASNKSFYCTSPFVSFVFVVNQ